MDVESVYVGYVSRTRGLKGELQLYFEWELYEELSYKTLFFKINGGLVPFFVDRFKLLNNRTGFFFFEDIDHIDIAQKLVGKEVYISSGDIPEQDEEAFLLKDLIGFEVTDGKSGNLGRILKIDAYPQQDIATVAFEGKELLFPLNDDFIERIDEEEQILYVNLPEGLVSIY
jgi:16S rRNA processing protein RimM